MPATDEFVAQQRKRSKPGVVRSVQPRQERSLRWFTANIDCKIRGARIIDLGSRDGYMVDRLAAFGAIAEGIEIVPETAEYARRELGRNILCGDLRQTAYADDSWDMATCLHALEHIPDPERGLAEIVRIVKPGGWILIVVPIEEEPSKGYAHNYAFHGEQDLIDMMSQYPVDIGRHEVKVLKDKSRAGGKSLEILLVCKKRA